MLIKFTLNTQLLEIFPHFQSSHWDLSMGTILFTIEMIFPLLPSFLSVYTFPFIPIESSPLSLPCYEVRWSRAKVLGSVFDSGLCYLVALWVSVSYSLYLSFLSYTVKIITALGSLRMWVKWENVFNALSTASGSQWVLGTPISTLMAIALWVATWTLKSPGAWPSGG